VAAEKEDISRMSFGIRIEFPVKDKTALQLPRSLTTVTSSEPLSRNPCSCQLKHTHTTAENLTGSGTAIHPVLPCGIASTLLDGHAPVCRLEEDYEDRAVSASKARLAAVQL
jgi:hypothetical protein